MHGFLNVCLDDCRLILELLCRRMEEQARRTLYSVLDAESLADVLRKVDQGGSLEEAAADLRRLLLQRLGATEEGEERQGEKTEKAADEAEETEEGKGAVLDVGVTLKDANEYEPLTTGEEQVKLRIGTHEGWTQEDLEVMVACPTCRKPLGLCIREAAVSSSTSVGCYPTPHGHSAGYEPTTASSSKCCVATVLPDGEQDGFLKAMLLGQSLISCGSTVERCLLHSDDVPGPYLDVLRGIWKLRRIGDWWCPS